MQQSGNLSHNLMKALKKGDVVGVVDETTDYNNLTQSAFVGGDYVASPTAVFVDVPKLRVLDVLRHPSREHEAKYHKRKRGLN